MIWWHKFKLLPLLGGNFRYIKLIIFGSRGIRTIKCTNVFLNFKLTCKFKPCYLSLIHSLDGFTSNKSLNDISTPIVLRVWRALAQHVIIHLKTTNESGLSSSRGISKWNSETGAGCSISNWNASSSQNNDNCPNLLVTLLMVSAEGPFLKRSTFPSFFCLLRHEPES